MRKIDWDKQFSGYHLLGIVLRNETYIYFLLQKHYPEDWDDDPEKYEDAEGVPWRLVVNYTEGIVEQQWTSVDLFGGADRVFSAAQYDGLEQCVVVTRSGKTYAVGSNRKGIEQAAGTGPRGLGATNAQTLFGKVHVTTSNGQIVRREGPDEWVKIRSREKHGRGMFDAISGFSPEDIYAVGNDGIVEHFDGTHWRRLSVPSSLQLNTVCCAEDGFVYIGGRNGTLLKGRGSRWKRLVKGDTWYVELDEMVWYADRLYFIARGGALYYLEGDEIKAGWHDEANPIPIGPSLLSVGDGMLLAANSGEAALFDGEKWQVIVSQYFDEEGVYRSPGEGLQKLTSMTEAYNAAKEDPVLQSMIQSLPDEDKQKIIDEFKKKMKEEWNRRNQ